MSADDRTEADQTLALDLMQTEDPEALIHKIHAYYADADRADRTPRSVLYLHIGLLCGVIGRMLYEHRL